MATAKKKAQPLDPIEDALRAAKLLKEFGDAPFGYSINERAIMVLAAEVERLRQMLKARR